MRTEYLQTCRITFGLSFWKRIIVTSGEGEIKISLTGNSQDTKILRSAISCAESLIRSGLSYLQDIYIRQCRSSTLLKTLIIQITVLVAAIWQKTPITQSRIFCFLSSGYEGLKHNISTHLYFFYQQNCFTVYNTFFAV